MLKPSMQDLMKRVNNRYLLVNLAAQRARDLSTREEETHEELPDKPVKIALDEINEGEIEYREGPKPEPEPVQDILEAAAAEQTDAAEELFADAEDTAEEAASDDMLSAEPETVTEEGLDTDELFR